MGTHSIYCHPFTIFNFKSDLMAGRNVPTARTTRSSAPEEYTLAHAGDGGTSDEEDEFGDEEEELDEWDVDEEAGAGIRVLTSFRGRSGGGGGQGEGEDDAADSGVEAEAEAEEEDEAMPPLHLTEEWRRQRALKGVEAKKERQQRQASKNARGSSGRFSGAQGAGEGQRQQGTRKRDRDYERREKERERLREKREAAAKEKEEYIRAAFRELQRFHLTGKVEHLIHTDEELFRAKGLASKINDFGRATAHGPYRERAAALYLWHRLVLEERELWCKAYASVAKATGKNVKTISQWVRGFHALGGKINRLLTGLQQRTPSYLDDRDVMLEAKKYIDFSISMDQRAARARKLAALVNKDRLVGLRLKKQAEDIVSGSTASTQGTASTDAAAATQQQDETQGVDGGDDDDIICSCKQPGGGAPTIYCESCDEHFHLECVGIDPRGARSLNRWGGWKCSCCEELAERNATLEVAEATLRGRDPIDRASEAQAAQAENPHQEFTGPVFHRWVNSTLLKDVIANGGKPISLRTARNWLHKLGYRWRARKRITYMDGHERDDVVE